MSLFKATPHKMEKAESTPLKDMHKLPKDIKVTKKIQSLFTQHAQTFTSKPHIYKQVIPQEIDEEV